MDTSKYFSYSDLTNQFAASLDDITSSTIHSTDIYATGNVNVALLTPNKFVGSDSNDNLQSRYLLGSLDMVTVTDASNNTVLTLPQKISPTSDVSFNHLNVRDVSSNNLYTSGRIITAITPNKIVGTDSSGVLTTKTISGTANQINILDTSGNLVLSTPQDLQTTSNVTFGNITSNGSITNSTLSTNLFIASDASKALVSRTLQGTANQVNINTVGTTTTLSLPQSISTTSDVSFNSLKAGTITGSALTASLLVATDASKSLISRTLQGTANQVLINTAANTTTLSLPQSIATNSDVSFNSINVGTVTSSNNITNYLQSNICYVNGNAELTTGTSYLKIGGLSNQIRLGPGNEMTISRPISGPLTPKTMTLPDLSGLVVLSETNNVYIKPLTNTKMLRVISDGSGNNNIVSSSYDETDFGRLTASNSWTNTNTFNGLTSTGTINYAGSGTGLSLSGAGLLDMSGGLLTIRRSGGYGAIQLAPQTANAEVDLSFWDNGISGASNGTLIGRNIASVGGFSIYNIGPSYNGISFGINTTTGVCNMPTLTASKLIISDSNKNLVSSTINDTDIVTLSGTQTITGNKTMSGTINLSSLTAGQYLALDSSKNITTSAGPTNYLTSNNTWTGTNQFNNTVKMNALTASQYLTLDASKNIVSSGVANGILLTTVGLQTISGLETFTDGIILSNTSEFRSYNFAVWQMTGSNQTISSATSILTWDTVAVANPLGVTIDASNFFHLPTVGMYQVQCNRRITSYTGETDFWISSTLDNGLYGITSVVNGQYYVSITGFIKVNFVPCLIAVKTFNPAVNLVIDNTTVAGANQINIVRVSTLLA